MSVAKSLADVVSKPHRPAFEVLVGFLGLIILIGGVVLYVQSTARNTAREALSPEIQSIDILKNVTADHEARIRMQESILYEIRGDVKYLVQQQGRQQ